MNGLPCALAVSAAVTLVACSPALAVPPEPPGPSALDKIHRFNDAMHDATLAMDTPAIVALWEDDGVTILPGHARIRGKQAIFAFIDDAVKKIPGAKMRTFELACGGIEIAGDWASEYCEEHQVVDIPGAKTFDGTGHLLFVLHRGTDGNWRLKREMWNEGGPGPVKAD